MTHSATRTAEASPHANQDRRKINAPTADFVVERRVPRARSQSSGKPASKHPKSGTRCRRAARAIAGQIFTDAGTGLRSPTWYRALTAQMLPSRLRVEFGRPFDGPEQSTAQGALAWIRLVYPALPARLRTVGPYQEAEAWLLGKERLDLIIRWLNQLWIGRPVEWVTARNDNVGFRSGISR